MDIHLEAAEVAGAEEVVAAVGVEVEEGAVEEAGEARAQPARHS